ncbi:MAG: FAD:protein FMN transferase [Firmicutes bacterium]|nr:FAD:protein FMN transferase [Bacillota bacterium]
MKMNNFRNLKKFNLNIFRKLRFSALLLTCSAVLAACGSAAQSDNLPTIHLQFDESAQSAISPETADISQEISQEIAEISQESAEISQEIADDLTDLTDVEVQQLAQMPQMIEPANGGDVPLRQIQPQVTPNPPNITTPRNPADYSRFNTTFIDLFDTVTILIGYAQNQAEFNHFANDVIRPELLRLHRLFDIHNEYPGLNNMRTVNQNAGVRPVVVDQIIIDLLKLSIDAYEQTNGAVDITLGAVIDLWRDAIQNTQTVPSAAALQAAARVRGVEQIVIDERARTVYIPAGMQLDTGGIAKGFAVETAAQLAESAGFAAFTLSVGGDVRVTAGPMSGNRDVWGVGVQNPSNTAEILDAIFITHNSVFSSGDYQRFFEADGVRYHHIIDPQTLQPARNFRATTIIHPNGAIADILATATFILDLETAKQVVSNLGGQALWILHDGSIITTDGYSQYGSNR